MRSDDDTPVTPPAPAQPAESPQRLSPELNLQIPWHDAPAKPAEAGAGAMSWVPCHERLPSQSQRCIIWLKSPRAYGYDGKPIHVSAATFRMGKSAVENPSGPWGADDQFGNNLVPYGWHGDDGPMHWWGQDVSHWMSAPPPPAPEQPTRKPRYEHDCPSTGRRHLLEGACPECGWEKAAPAQPAEAACPSCGQSESNPWLGFGRTCDDPVHTVQPAEARGEALWEGASFRLLSDGSWARLNHRGKWVWVAAHDVSAGAAQSAVACLRAALSAAREKASAEYDRGYSEGLKDAILPNGMTLDEADNALSAAREERERDRGRHAEVALTLKDAAEALRDAAFWVDALDGDPEAKRNIIGGFRGVAKRCAIERKRLLDDARARLAGEKGASDGE